MVLRPGSRREAQVDRHGRREALPQRLRWIVCICRQRLWQRLRWHTSELDRLHKALHITFYPEVTAPHQQCQSQLSHLSPCNAEKKSTGEIALSLGPLSSVCWFCMPQKEANGPRLAPRVLERKEAEEGRQTWIYRDISGQLAWSGLGSLGLHSMIQDHQT